MPPRMQRVTNHMLHEDWLGSYTDLAGVENSLNGVSRRIRFANNLYGAIAEVVENYHELEHGFLEFFPLLQTHMNQLQETCNGNVIVDDNLNSALRIQNQGW